MMPLSIAPDLQAPAPPRSRRATGATATHRTALLLVVVPVLVMTMLIGVGPRGVVVLGREDVSGWLGRSAAAESLLDAVGGLEALGNLLLFVPLAAVVVYCIPKARLLPALGAVVVLPLLVEIAQGVLPGRVPDEMDVIRNTAGVVVAFAVASIARWSVRGGSR